VAFQGDDVTRPRPRFGAGQTSGKTEPRADIDYYLFVISSYAPLLRSHSATFSARKLAPAPAIVAASRVDPDTPAPTIRNRSGLSFMLPRVHMRHRSKERMAEFGACSKIPCRRVEPAAASAIRCRVDQVCRSPIIRCCRQTPAQRLSARPRSSPWCGSASEGRAAILVLRGRLSGNGNQLERRGTPGPLPTIDRAELRVAPGSIS
jgi:hypothetical protein